MEESIMAMIECPVCKGLISDKAKKCVHCDTLLIPKERCRECNAALEENMITCPKCGCPVNGDNTPIRFEASLQAETTGSKKTHKKLSTIIIVIVALLIIVMTAALGIRRYQIERTAHERAAQEAIQYSQEYAENLKLATYTMLSGAADAESCCNLICQVWNNAIWQKEDSATDNYTKPDGYFVDDFNFALENLFADPKFYTQINAIKENQETVTSIIAQLKNPSEEYKTAYESLSEYYDAYLTFTNLAINPSGSLNTFSEDFDAIDEKCLHCYQVMVFYIQD